MKIRLETFPIEHIIIEDFFTQSDCQISMAELSENPNWIPGLMYRPDIGYFKDESRKRLKNLDLYGQVGHNSFTASTLKNNLWSDEVRSFFDKQGSGSIWSFMNETNVDFATVNHYGNNDCYDWHGDRSIVTMNLFITPNPTFTGGDFVLSNQIGASYEKHRFTDNNKRIEKVIPFTSGTAVLFSGRYQHMVTKVITKSEDFFDGRVTIQNRSFLQ